MTTTTRGGEKRDEYEAQKRLLQIELLKLQKWSPATAAKEDMFASPTPRSRRDLVNCNDKKHARVNAMRHVLGRFDYDDEDHEVVGEADPLIVGRARTD